MMQSLGEPSGVGLKPERHIGGFSIRKEDGSPLPLIFEAAVGKARDTVVLKLAGPIPEKAFLWYGHGLDPVLQPDRRGRHGRPRVRADRAGRGAGAQGARGRDGAHEAAPCAAAIGVRHPRPPEPEARSAAQAGHGSARSSS